LYALVDDRTYIVFAMPADKSNLGDQDLLHNVILI